MALLKLDGKVAVVSGGGTGIGRAIALGLAREGSDVLVFSRTIDEVETTVDEINLLGRRGLALRGDVTSHIDVARIMRRAIAEFGHVDIMVNNAGIQGPIGLLASNEISGWISTVHTHLIGTFLCCKAILPHMIARRQGKIINLSGGGAATSRPRFSAYATSKAGVVRLTEVLADEVKEFNIQVNAIAPGMVNTRLMDDILAAGKMAGAQEIRDAELCKETGGTSPDKAANLVVFLSSSDGDCITGRLISAVWDDWSEIARRCSFTTKSGALTLRRIDQHTLGKINEDWLLFEKGVNDLE